MVKRFIISFLSCMLLMTTQVIYSQVGPIQKGESLWCITERIGNTSDEILSKVCDIQEEFPIDCASQSSVDQVQTTSDEILSKVCDIQEEFPIDCASQSSVDQVQTTSDEILSKVCAIQEEFPIDCASQSSVDQVQTTSDEILSKVCAIQEEFPIDCASQSSVDQVQITSDEILSKVCAIQEEFPIDCASQSSVDQVQTTSDEILSKVCAIQEEFPIDCASQSTADEILMKVCNIQDELSLIDVDCTQGKISIFGAQISECRDDQVNVQFQYGIAPSEVRSVENGAGQVEPSLIDGMACLVLDQTDSGTAFIESKRFVRYRSGHETFGVFSAAFANSSANSTQWIGLFDDDNGAAVGFDGVDFSILYRVGGVDTTIPQSSFNKDPLDGSGASGFLLNPMNLNIFRISFGWLGASPIMYQILTEDGKWLVFHTIERGNLFTTPSFTNPIVPVRAEIDGTTVNNPLQLCTACWDAGIIGCPSVAGNRYFTKDNIVTLKGKEEQTAIIIRNKDTYRGKTNKITIRVAVFGGGMIEQQNDKAVLRLYTNATFTNVPTFSDVNSVNSVAEISTDGTFDVSAAQGGVEVLAIGNNTDGSGPIINFIPKNEFSILLEPGDTITLTVSNLTGGNNDVVGIIGWEELY